MKERMIVENIHTGERFVQATRDEWAAMAKAWGDDYDRRQAFLSGVEEEARKSGDWRPYNIAKRAAYQRYLPCPIPWDHEMFDGSTHVFRRVVSLAKGGAKMYAAIGSDGMRLVVWGLGKTHEKAERDARKELVASTPDLPDNTDLTIIECTPEAAARVREGEVSCEGDSSLMLEGFKHNARSGNWSADRLIVRPKAI